jgi:hypothetical protein
MLFGYQNVSHRTVYLRGCLLTLVGGGCLNVERLVRSFVLSPYPTIDDSNGKQWNSLLSKQGFYVQQQTLLWMAPMPID